MRQLVLLRRIIGQGVVNFFRNAWLSVAATAVMFVALTIGLIGLVLNIATTNAISELSKNLQISVYLRDDAPQERREALQAVLQGGPDVASVTFVSKQQAQERFVANFQADTQLLEGLALVGGETLPSSIEISVSSLSRINDIGQIAEREEYKDIVESVSLGRTDSRRTIERAEGFQRFVVRTSIGAGLVFTIVSMLIIFNTIRMAIFTRGEEIRIMKLIGATPGYIRGPFLVEGAMYGVVAGIIAICVLYAGIFSLERRFGSISELSGAFEAIRDPMMVLQLIGGALGAGVIIAVSSSLVAMSRHLRLRRW